MSPEFREIFFSLGPATRAVREGEFLFREGERPQWIILAENLNVIEWVNGINQNPCSEGIEKVWGMREALTDTEFASTAIAGREMDCFLIPKETFLLRAREDAFFRLTIMQQIAREINRRQASFE